MHTHTHTGLEMYGHKTIHKMGKIISNRTEIHCNITNLHVFHSDAVTMVKDVKAAIISALQRYYQESGDNNGDSKFHTLKDHRHRSDYVLQVYRVY